MKSIITFCVIATVGMSMLFTCPKAQSSSTEKNELGKDKKVLIVYLSRTKNTKALAAIIPKKVGGNLVTPYPEH